MIRIYFIPALICAVMICEGCKQNFKERQIGKNEFKQYREVLINDIYKDDNLNDESHICDSAKRAEKNEILNRIIEIDDWYRQNFHGIFKYDKNDFWMSAYKWPIEDAERLSLIKDSVIPSIQKCPFFTDSFKAEALKNTRGKDPGNLGKILTNSIYGQSTARLTAIRNPREWAAFHYKGLKEDGYSDDPDYTPDTLTYEEIKFHHLSMIKIYDSTHAIYRITNHISSWDQYRNGFLTIELINKNNQWLVYKMLFYENASFSSNRKLIDYNYWRSLYELQGDCPP